MYIQHGPEKTEAKLTPPTQGGVSNPIGKSDTLVTQQAPIIALRSLTGLSILVLALVIIGWVWTCWSIKKKREMGHMTTTESISSKNT